MTTTKSPLVTLATTKPVDYPGKDALTAALRPVFEPLARNLARGMVQRLMGFWVLWNTYGSIQGLVDSGLMNRSSVYRQRADFLAVFGVNVEDWLPVSGASLAVETKTPIPAGARRKAGVS